MKVYLVLGHTDYEGSEVLSAWSSQESANAEQSRLEAAKDNYNAHKYDDAPHEWEYFYDRYSTEFHEVKP